MNILKLGKVHDGDVRSDERKLGAALFDQIYHRKIDPSLDTLYNLRLHSVKLTTGGDKTEATLNPMQIAPQTAYQHPQSKPKFHYQCANRR